MTGKTISKTTGMKEIVIIFNKEAEYGKY